jgi:uncharacterized protein YutE (UPF0331/DUF86 family)
VNLAREPPFSPELVRDLERLPRFRNVLVHDYVVLDMGRVVEALDRLDSAEHFAELVRCVEAAAG